MFRLILREDQDVIEVNSDLSLGDQVTEDVIHHPLERGRRIGKPEEHDGGLVQAPVCAEGGFLLVTLSDSDIVVSPTNVELCEVLGSTQFVDELRDERQRVAILDRHLVELSVVLDGT